MKTSDLFVGSMFVLNGVVLYLCNYKRSDSKGRVYARAGLGSLAL